jgi:homoserine acetyltransferase
LHFSFSQLALNTTLLLDKLKMNKAYIVGHSMGGMLATTFTVIYSSFVKKLIPINPICLEAYGQFAQFKDVNFFNYWN